MQTDLTFWPENHNLCSICTESPVEILNLEIMSSFGARIRPIVGDYNCGADFLINEVVNDCRQKKLSCLVINVANTGLDCPSIIDVVVKKIGWDLRLGEDPARCAADRIIACDYRVLTITGASHLTKEGIREMTVFMDCLSRFNSACRPPVVIWHARPNWESTFKPEAPPQQYFLGNFYVPTADPKATPSKICSALPYVGPIIIGCKGDGWGKVMEKTTGQLGSLRQLDCMAFSLHRLETKIGSETKILDLLLRQLLGESRDSEVLASRPPNRATYSKGSGILAPPCQERSFRGKPGNRNKRLRKSMGG